MRRSYPSLLLLLSGLLTVAIANGANPKWPQPPCDGAVPRPAYADVGAVPRVEVWYGEDADRVWTPPACTGWQRRPYTVLVATAGRFRHRGDSHSLLQRLGAVSQQTRIRYWSASRQRWRGLVKTAYALQGPDRTRRRHDFGARELVPGRDLYFWQEETRRAGATLFQLRIRQRSPRRIVAQLSNAAPVHWFLMTLFERDHYQFFYVLERESEAHWRYYSLMRASTSYSGLVKQYQASYVNRAVAIFRHFAAIPTDHEPPAARHR